MSDKLIVLDLDETLIFANTQPLARPADFTVGPYHVYKRPYLAEFLTFVFKKFQVGVWTSSSRAYAYAVVDNIMSPHARLAFLWSSERCSRYWNLETDEIHAVKKLKKLERRGYSMDSILAIDDSPEKHLFNDGNLLCVRSFVGDPRDDELRLLIPYLEQLRAVANLRTVEKRCWRPLGRD